ncbi:hypothetical protein BTM25_25690 [Actinomadura rubteroloni]|uniref:Uncharacterized protein n=1 Tax=Actinomadura rubteroloni TaxID=1926885 RepID=A0A2P4UFW9_9ACTN|nr:hypothetical protein [Actinomadura rubteroloni]POM23942.1 hypothetical protein BTM25_25690 [Actinomadura rubteroloni]
MDDDDRGRGTARPRATRPARPVRRAAPARSARTRRAAGRPAPPRKAPERAPAPEPRKAVRPPRRNTTLANLDHRLYFAAAAALLVVVVLLIAVVASGGDAPRRAAAPDPAAGNVPEDGPSPASYSSTANTPAFAAIAQRSKDAAPLTAGEAFPSYARELRTDGGTRLTLRAKRLDGCRAAVWGGGLAADLARSGCTQAVRTLYTANDPKPGYALSVTVLNLAGAADADRLVRGLDAGRAAGFVRPLPVDGAAFGGGFGMARGLAVGHYAVVAWAERLDGSGDASDTTLLALLIEGGKAPAALGRAAKAG